MNAEQTTVSPTHLRLIETTATLFHRLLVFRVTVGIKHNLNSNHILAGLFEGGKNLPMFVGANGQVRLVTTKKQHLLCHSER